MSRVSVGDRRASRVSFAQSIASAATASSCSRPVSTVFEATEARPKHEFCELLLNKMLAQNGGLLLSDRRTLLWRKASSCFAGSELISWLKVEVGFDTREEARLLALKLCAAGYMYPLRPDVKIDSRLCLMRIQPPCFWPSYRRIGNDFDYAVFLRKELVRQRRLNLAERESLAALQEKLKRRWPVVRAYAKAQAAAEAQISASQRDILVSQERAYWESLRRPSRYTARLGSAIESLGRRCIDMRAIDSPQWAASLAQLLSNPAGRQLYRDFLDAEKSSENLDFWCACDALPRCEPHELPMRVRIIYATFLDTDAPREVNIPDAVRQTIVSELSGGSVGPAILQPAQQAVYKLMAEDSYIRFLQCDAYRSLRRRGTFMPWLTRA